MIPHPTTMAAVQESDRRQLSAWIDRDRRATSALGNGARRTHTRRRILPFGGSTKRAVTGRALMVWAATANLRRHMRPGVARPRGSAILARFSEMVGY